MPHGDLPAPQHVGDLVYLDYADVAAWSIPANRSQLKYRYLLVIKDALSGHIYCEPTDNVTAASAALHLSHYFGRLGLRASIVATDQGVHFASELFKELLRRSAVTPRYSVTYSAWANGVAESGVKKVKVALRHVMSRLRVSMDMWPFALSVVESAVNGTPTKRLGGRCPLELVVGAAPKRAIDSIVRPLKGKATMSRRLTPDEISDIAAKLSDALEEMHAKAATLREVILEREHHRHKHRTMAKLPQWTVGTYVLKLKPKTRRKAAVSGLWTGPYQVTAVCSPHVYEIVRLGGNKTPIRVHVARLRYFSSSHLNASETLVDQALFEDEAWPIEDILDHADGDDGTLVQVSWQGFKDAEDRTWEPLGVIADTAQGLLRKYARKQDKATRDKLIREIEAATA